jgi:hypothetical protein
MNVKKENAMKINMLTKRLVGFGFAVSLLLGVGFTGSSVANAQYQDPYWRQQQQREQIRRQREWEREQRRRNRDDRRYDDRRYDQYGQYGYGVSANFRQTALNAGYNEGIKEGRKDRNRGQRYDFRDIRAYRNADTDYNSRYGNKALYQQFYRQGFQNGYADGLRGY